ncbi:MAG: zinc ABC transporter substrate-binding protein, partial [Nitrospirae bacterium]|nr:zinc ABC transporter substrate-binding protein [Nitrospirota bacterium]
MLPSSPMLNLRFLRLLWAILISLSLLAAPLVLAASPAVPLNIVVTIPVLKDLAEQVGGPHVRVTSLLSGYENEHTYSPKPSDLVAVRKARLLFEIGIGLEVWVSSLVKNAGSSSLRVVTTSNGIALLRDKSDHDGAAHAGEEDDRGNPHVWMDPENAATMMRHITEALIQADPAHATEYRANQASYLRKLDQLRGDLIDRIARLADRRFIAHHPAWPYFARRFGFQIVGTIQPQSGSEPSALHLHGLIAKIKKDRIKVVVSEIQLSQK